MAIAFLGAVAINASAGDGSTSITIPSGATLAVITSTCWDSGGAATPLANVVIDGQNDTGVIALDVGASDENSVYLSWAKNFSTGASKTVSWTYTVNAAIDEGAGLFITFWSGTDLTNPFADYDSARATGTTGVQVAGLTTPANSVVQTMVQAFGGTPEMQADGAPTINAVYNDDGTGVASTHAVDIDYFARTQATHTIDMTGENYSVIIAVALAEAAAGADTLMAQTVF